MTTPTTTDPRADRARLIASTAGQWLKVRAKDGKKYYGVPSQADPTRRYLVNLRSCTCPDFQRRGGPCKHIAAVQLYVARVRAARAREGVVAAA